MKKYKVHDYVARIQTAGDGSWHGLSPAEALELTRSALKQIVTAQGWHLQTSTRREREGMVNKW